MGWISPAPKPSWTSTATAPTVTATRARAERLGVRGVPTLRAGDRTLEGFQSHGTILAFLQQAAVR